MLSAVDWDSLSTAGAFVVGSIFGTIVTLRVLRIAMNLGRDRKD